MKMGIAAKNGSCGARVLFGSKGKRGGRRDVLRKRKSIGQGGGEEHVPDCKVSLKGVPKKRNNRRGLIKEMERAVRALRFLKERKGKGRDSIRKKKLCGKQRGRHSKLGISIWGAARVRPIEKSLEARKAVRRGRRDGRGGKGGIPPANVVPVERMS